MNPYLALIQLQKIIIELITIIKGTIKGQGIIKGQYDPVDWKLIYQNILYIEKWRYKKTNNF